MIKFYTISCKALLIALLFLVSINFVDAQCTPSNIGANSQVGITNFSITGDSSTSINNTSPKNQQYGDYTSKSINVTVGNTYAFTTTNENGSWSNNVKTLIWIDYEGTGNFISVFDSGGFTTSLNQSGSFEITKRIQNTAVLRIASFYCPTCDPKYDTGPCNFLNKYAEVEDYTLNIALPSTPKAYDDTLVVTKNSTSGTANQINIGTNDTQSINGGGTNNYTITALPAHGNINEISDDVFEYIPNTNYIGSDSFTYSFCDNSNNCDTATVNIAVNLGACIPNISTNGFAITNVTLVGENASSINNNSGDDGGYGNYLNVPSVDLKTGGNYTVSMSVTGEQMHRVIYIDYNQNGTFEGSEKIAANSSSDSQIPFTIPNTALLGSTVMRVGIQQYWYSSSSSPCGSTLKTQEFEDYFVNIYPINSSIIKISGNNNNIANGATTTDAANNTYFGNIGTSAPVTKIFTITNNGTEDLILPTSAVKFSTSTSDFSIVSQPASTTIAPGGTTTFEVGFTPSSSGLKQAKVTIENNDPIKSPYTFLIEGEGTTSSAPVTINGSYALYFDGVDDYVESPELFNSLTDITIMCWIKPGSDSSTEQFVLGQDNFNIKLNGKNIRTNVNGSLLRRTSTNLPQDIWVHVALTYNSTTNNAYMYVNGEVIVDSKNYASGLTPASINSLSIGKTPGLNQDYFIGEIDEVRVFSTALTEEDIQQMMYQELDENFAFTQGTIIPKGISGGSNLLRYYKMDNFINTTVIDKTGHANATMYNNDGNTKTLDQTAPLPYVTNTDGDWDTESTWLHGTVWDIHNAGKDWAIVNVKNNITTSRELTTAGLIINAGAKITLTNHSALNNTWYLNIEDTAVIDLQDGSQLIQTATSSLGTGTGIVERDQKGTANKYAYNYWSSPVHTGNKNFSLKDVLFDGTDPNNLKAISFVGGYNGDNTGTTLKLAEYWIWKYANKKSDHYASWQHVKSTGKILSGEGYTMKGPGTGSISTEQNYTFKGIPNNGDITLPISPNNEYLVGNPYPSALDAHEFLLENQNTIDGTIYFWEHYGGDSHYSVDYEGGYGVYTLSGGTPAMTGSNTHPNSKKTPTRYIPVGQGFFVKAANTISTDTDLMFTNNQRIFATENNTSSVFLKSTSNKTSNTKAYNTEDIRPKLRINYKSPKGYIRQLLTTVDKNATMGKDWGYDGLLNETNIEDMYWNVEDADYIIQGIDAITTETVLPITVKSQNGGLIEISIAALENVADNIEVYLKDKSNAKYYDLKASVFNATVDAGVISDRFEITFATDNTLGLENEESISDLQLFYNTTNDQVIINNPKNQNIKTLQAVNMLGQVVFKQDINTFNKKVTIPTHLPTGMYVFSIHTTETQMSKKIVVSK